MHRLILFNTVTESYRPDWVIRRYMMIIQVNNAICAGDVLALIPSLCGILVLIIKITISSVLIGLKKAYFPLIRLPSCYRTVCYWIVCYRTVCYRTVCYRTVQKANHIQRCSLKQPITFKVVITCACTCACFCVFAFFFVLLLYFNANFPLFSQLGYFSRKL